MSEPTIRPPQLVPGMEKPLRDYSERLARRSDAVEKLVKAKYTSGGHDR